MAHLLALAARGGASTCIDPAPGNTSYALEMEILWVFSTFWQQAAQVLVAFVVTTATILWVYCVVCVDHEESIAFTVPRPEQCKPGWRGCTLGEPQIKVPA